MPESLTLLWSLMDMPGAALSNYAASLWGTNVFQAALALGFLREAEPATWVTCPECFEHEEEVIVRPGRNGGVCYAIPCPEVLRAEVSLNDMRQWRVDMAAVASTLARALQLAGKPTELAPGRVWRLGRWKYQGQARDMLLAIGLNQPDAIDIRRQITASRRPVVFVPLAEPGADFWVGQPPPLIRLSEVVSLVDSALGIDTTEIVGLIQDADERTDNTPDSLSFVLDQKVRSALNSRLTDELILQAYVANGSSARKAAKALKKRGHSIHHATISRLVKKYEEVLRTGSSESVVRTRSSQRRDTPIEKRD